MMQNWEAKKTNELFDSMLAQLKRRVESSTINARIMRKVAELQAAGYRDDVALAQAMEANGLSTR